MKKILLFLVLLSAGLSTNAQCTGYTCDYTFRMSDDFGDGWDGSEMEVIQFGVTVATLTGPAAAGPEDVLVPLCNGAPFDLVWTVTGGFPNEKIIEVLDATGASIYAMPAGSGALAGTTLFSGTSTCPPCPGCDYTFRMSDDFGDGWDGSVMEVTQFGAVVATLTGPAAAGPEDVLVPLCDGYPFTLDWTVTGGFPNEKIIEILDPTGTSLYLMPAGSGALAGTTLFTGTVACPACAPPSGISATVGTDAATLTWVAGAGAASYDWEVQLASDPQGTVTTLPSGTGLAALTVGTGAVLSSGTDYTFYIVSDCGGGYVSFNFSTTPDYCGGDLFLDSGGAAGSYSSNEAETYVICPDNPTDLVTVNFTFVDIEGAPWDILDVYDGTGTGGTLLQTDLQSPQSFTSSGPGVCLTFDWVSDNSVQQGGWSAGVTCALPPTCDAPTALAIGSISTTSALASWTSTETAFDIGFGVAPFAEPTAPNTGYDNVGATGSQSLTGLTANTTYEYWVRTDCDAGTAGSGGQSTWSGPFSFTTLCTPYTAPYTESFDAGPIDVCHSQSAVAGGPWVLDGGFGWNTGGCAATPSDHTGNAGRFIAVDFSTGGGADDGVVFQLNDVDVSSLTTPYLDFYHFMCGSGYSPLNQTIVEAWDGSAWGLVGTVNSGSASWENYGFDLSTHTFGVNLVRIRFRAENGGPITSGFVFYGDQALDDISIIEAPTCIAPLALTASSIAATSALLGWTSTETAFDVVIGVSPVTVPTAATIPTFSTSVSSNVPSGTLVAQTDYQYYVRTDCDAGTAGSGGQSTWAGPFDFTTACAPITTFPACTDFSVAGGVPSCWSDVGTEAWLSAGTWPLYGADVMDNSGFLGVDGSGTNTLAQLLSESYDLSAVTWTNPPQLSFDIFSNNIDNPGDNALVTIEVSDDFGATWSTLTTYQADNAAVTSVTADLSAYTADVVSFRFNVDFSVMVNDQFYNDILINNVCVEETPSCLVPTALVVSSITGNSAVLSWTPGASGETEWDVEFGVAPFAATGTPTAGYDDLTSPTATFTGLTSSTTYEGFVRADCDAALGTDESAWVPFTFTTAQDFCAGDLFLDSGGSAGNYSSGEDITTVICPANPWDDLTVTFTSFNTEQGWDGMMIYDGPSAASPLISSGSTFNRADCPNGAWTGDAGIGQAFAPTAPFVSTDVSGCLTFVFTSDGSVTRPGWEATAVCTPTAPPGSIIWNGSTDTDWTNAANWTGGAPPFGCSDHIFIPFAPFQPSLTAVRLVGELTTGTDASIDIQTGVSLDVCGDMTLGDASFSSGDGSINLLDDAGSGSSVLSVSDATINKLVVEGNYTMISGSMGIAHSLTLAGGDFANAGGNVELLSDVSATAYLDDFSNPGNSYSGNLKVNRFVTDGHISGKGQRYFGTAVSGSVVTGLDNTFFPGYPLNGYIIPIAACDPDSILPSSPYSNLMSYDENVPTFCTQAGWFAENTNTHILVPTVGYSGWMNNLSTISVTGTPNTGAQSSGVLSNTPSNSQAAGYHIMSNPYPSPILLSEVTNGTGLNSVQYYEGSSGPYSGTFQPAGLSGPEIPVMQGFSVLSTGAGNMTLDNGDRVASTNANFAKEDWFDMRLDVEVLMDGNADMTYIFYSDNSTAQFDEVGDCYKRSSDANKPTLYTICDGENMSLNGLANTDLGTSIPMGLIAPTETSATFSFSGMDDFPMNTTIYVEDKVEGIFHNVADGDYTFEADPAENGTDRFEIHFVLPVSFEIVEATCDNTNGAIVDNTNDGRTFNVLTDGVIVGNGSLNGAQYEFAAGDYTMEVFDQFGGSQSYDFTVIEITPVTAGIISSATVIEAGESIDFEFNGSDANTYEWTINGQAVAQTELFSYEFTNPGQYVVEVYAANDLCDALATQTIDVAEKTTSIIEVGNGTLSIYESNGNVVLNFSNVNKGKVEAAVFNLLGQEVASMNVESSGKQTIQNVNWANGYYLVKVQIGEQVVNETILLTK